MGIQPRNKNLLSTAMYCLSLVLFSFVLLAPRVAAQQSFSLEQVMSAPFPSDFVAANTVRRVAWAFDEKRNRSSYSFAAQMEDSVGRQTAANCFSFLNAAITALSAYTT